MKTIAPKRLFKIAVLTAASQEGSTPRQRFIEDPLGASRERAFWWIGSAKKLGIDLQLAADLQRPDSYIPPEALLDPKGIHLPIRTFTDGTGIDLSDADLKEIIARCGGDVSIINLGFFENLLHPDPKIRKQIHEHLLRCLRAAVALQPVGCRGVTGFIGRNWTKDMDQNMAEFERDIIPILKQFKAMGMTYWVENCPMPGWYTGDHYFYNIAYCPGNWIMLHRICEKHDVAGVLQVTYDASHDGLLGTNHHASFSAMKAAGLESMITQFHGKPNHADAAQRALWSLHGQKILTGCRFDGEPSADPAELWKAWKVLTANHGMIGFDHHNLLAMMMGHAPDWVGHQLDARHILGMEPDKSWMVLEYEWQPLRQQQDDELVLEMLGISIDAMQGYDLTADALYRGHQFCAKREVSVPGQPNPLHIYTGLEELTKVIVA